MAQPQVRWRIDTDVGLDETPQVLARFTALLDRHRPVEVICDVAGIEQPSLGTVNALSRMALLAKRRRARLRLTGIGPRLWTLLRLTGLDRTLG